ncbi:MAG: hypothetical protein LBH19_02100 [Dysgonamonadaceae bacterium]|jgi:hypothetical protein|nr:hypothetical protein [Dysgonamonadaceae bacterium]
MTDSKVIIKDASSLLRLRDALDFCGDSLLKLLREVDNYLQAILQQFERQRDCFKEQLEQAEQALQEAEQALQEAENDYSDCLASQREYEDEDGHTYVSPSCSSERSCVESARRHKDECQAARDECKRKLDAAERIVSDCKHEIDEYKFRGGILRPNGAEYTLEYIADGHTEEAIRKMDEIVEVIEEYLGRRLAETNPNDGLTSTQAQKFQAASEKVKAKQKSEAESNKIADANAEGICPNCKQPIANCQCARSENQRGHTNFQPPLILAQRFGNQR